ncbi:hypothetical protein SAMN04488047_14115 [Tranquillimonas alkanivorans]|uniref:Uncharacterized protein n=1 Tax=Tranquillimonas alkanivorans TaxID=441119 RepID=A0A1I5W7B8_9RHOB|nr:hypothetical protein SAMN04488047_14115 [Tranquillimonas alkanivorans]
MSLVEVWREAEPPQHFAPTTRLWRTSEGVGLQQSFYLLFHFLQRFSRTAHLNLRPCQFKRR